MGGIEAVEGELLAAVFQAPGVLFDHGGIDADSAQALQDRQADGAGADHDGAIVFHRGGAADAVHADAEGLHQGDLHRVQGVAQVELFGRNGEAVAHAAVGVDAEDFELRAAVGAAALASPALAAGEVGVDGAMVAGAEVVDAFADGEHFHGQFMAEDTGGR